MADATKKLTHTAEQIDAAVGMLLEVYTRDEIDDLLAQKITAVPGSGLMTDDERDKLANLENYDDSEVKTDIATNSSAITVLTNSGQKNLLKNMAVSKTQNGVTFTVNADGTVSVSGTATAGVTLPIGQVEVEKGRTYALSGCPAGGSSLTYRLDARYYKNGTLTTIGSTIDVGEGTVIKLPEDADDNRLLIYIRIGDGTDGGGRIFTPMLRYAEIVDDAYKTYSMSNVELTETVESHNEQISKNTEMIAETSSQTTLNHSTLGYQRKNLLKNTAVSRTINGVTLTVNENGSVTLNGTAAATVFFEIRKGMLLETGREYILSGCPVGGSTSSYTLLIEDSSQGRTWDFGKGIKFTAASTNYDVKIRINVNYTAENLTFRPMLRYAEIADDTYEPYKDDLQTQIDNITTEKPYTLAAVYTRDLTSGEDLSKVIAPGVYRSATAAITNSLANKPDDLSSGFKMIVEVIQGASHVLQTIKSQAGKTYIRHLNLTSGAADNWFSLVSSDELADLEARVAALEGGGT